MTVYTDWDEEGVSFISDDPMLLKRPTSIAHWQLRDLVSAGPNENEFYCVSGAQVILYNAAKRQSEAVMNLGFQPNSMTCSHGFLAAGGLRSELEVRDLATNTICFKNTLGGLVNNSLHVGVQLYNEKRLFVCNNDDTIKVFQLPSMQPVDTIRCHIPINYASLSPDGRQLVCVGDCNSTLVYGIAEGGYELASSMTEASDVGMCTAWNATGSLFASSHQDGTTCVWDRNSGKVVAKYNFDSAARCLKFARGPMDLLAVSEHEDLVHLIDTRCWTAVQCLAPLPDQPEADISGIAFSNSGLRLWVGLEPSCACYQIDSLKRRSFEVPGELLMR